MVAEQRNHPQASQRSRAERDRVQLLRNCDRSVVEVGSEIRYLPVAELNAAPTRPEIPRVLVARKAPRRQQRGGNTYTDGAALHGDALRGKVRDSAGIKIGHTAAGPVRTCRPDEVG